MDAAGPSILLNGERSFFRGVGLHAETLTFDADANLTGGTPAQRPEDVLRDLRDAAAVGADLVRTGHQPADPLLVMLADRLGFAVWEEIPLYHTTPLVFERSMGRGIPQQMLREMALRDMNRPSVLFHGFANESTGDEERTDALAELHEIDRAIDGTRLTGQAAYGWRPDDPTHAPLDVAGMTSYQGVFYGDDPAADTRRALIQAHDAYPDKPIMVLEFGRWADLPVDEERQRTIFDETYGAIEAHRGDELGGFVGGATWWALHDFTTPLAGIGLEQFGLFRPDGSLRPAGQHGVGDVRRARRTWRRAVARPAAPSTARSTGAPLGRLVADQLRRLWPGSLDRRPGDPAVRPDPARRQDHRGGGMRHIRGRLAAVSVRAAFVAGAWVGGALGLVVGAVLGAILAWGAGTILEWQRDLGFTLGVARSLLPLGEQVAALRWVSSTWWLVVPAVALAVAIVAGLTGGLIGALLAVAYNRSPRHAAVVVELPESEESAD